MVSDSIQLAKSSSPKIHSFWLLMKDEFLGFWKSKVMIVLWIGVPLISILMHFFQPDTEGMPFISLVGLVTASISGTLGSVMLATTVVNERNKHIYDLFLIRAVKRHYLLLAKLVAVYICILIANIIAIGLGFIIDQINGSLAPDFIIRDTFNAIGINMAAIAIACSAGVFIGILTDSVMVSAILAIYLGNQLSMLAILPGIILENIDPLLFSAIVGVVATGLIIFCIIKVFAKKMI
ncbi:MAG: hypothetical protein ACTSWL_02520 [Promethearchaeota archaeon]